MLSDGQGRQSDLLPIFPSNNNLYPAMRSKSLSSDTPVSLKAPNHSHHEAVWDYFRPTITALYLERGLKLEDVRTEMEKRFSFKASRKMYNIRILRWGIKKNILSSEKQELVDEIAANDERGLNRPLMINGRTVDRMDKIERYLKAQKRHAARKRTVSSSPVIVTPSESDSNETEGNDVDTSNQHQHLILQRDQNQEFQIWLRSLLPKTSVPASIGLCRYETVLQLWGKGMRIWIADSPRFPSVKDSTFTNEQHYRMTNEWYLDVLSSLVHARRSLELRSIDDARTSLDRFCAQLGAMLKTQYWPFVNALIAETVSCLWKDFSEWRVYVYSFLVRMSSRVLGNDHHATQLFRLLADADWVDNLSVSMMRLGIDVMDQDQDAYVDHSYELIRDGINVFMWSGDIPAAKNYALQHVMKAQREFGSNHWVTHRALRILAFIYKRNDELLESREILLRVLYSDILDPNRQNGSVIESSTDILIFLGDVCGRLGLFDECTKHLERFLEVSPLELDTASEEWCCRALCLLPESLLRSNRLSEIHEVPSVPDSVAGRRARAWANVRLQYWPSALHGDVEQTSSSKTNTLKNSQNWS